MSKKIEALPCEIEEISATLLEQEIKLCGFLERSKILKEFGFFTLRAGLVKIQCVVKPGNEINNEKYAEICELPLESYITITGLVKKALMPVKRCSVKEYEIDVLSVNVLSVAGKLPFLIKDINVKQEGMPKVNFNKRLDFRCLDLRGTLSQSIFRIIDEIMFSFRTFLRKEKFIEIKSSKLCGSASEGGANLFEVSFFKQKAYLAQSPQLYKQMAITGNLRRVYEIGHVYRAEESNTNRYLSEFVGLDLEMESESYIETIHLIYRLLSHIIKGLRENMSSEIENLRSFKHFEDVRFKETPLILTHRACIDLLKKHGAEIEYGDDFNRAMEKKLGNIVADEMKVDFFVVKDYPIAHRPFYSEACEDGFYSKSFDFILRGEEILSGAQRLSNYEKLCKSAESKGIDLAIIEGYLSAFKYGAPPHAGCGIGLERFAKSLFDFPDIRCFNLFPRDPNRLYP